MRSPANKVAGARGRASYIEKHAEMMRSQSHWMEIDLLRSGEPIVARETLPEGDYFVHVSRVQKRPRGYVWPIRLEERLPVVGVPLGGGDPDAPLDLQAVLDAAYKPDRGTGRTISRSAIAASRARRFRKDSVPGPTCSSARNRCAERGSPPVGHASSFSTISPWTSVRRKSRP